MTEFAQDVTGKLGDMEETPSAIIRDKVIREFARQCDRYGITQQESALIAKQLSQSFCIAASAIVDEE